MIFLLDCTVHLDILAIWIVRTLPAVGEFFFYALYDEHSLKPNQFFCVGVCDE